MRAHGIVGDELPFAARDHHRPAREHHAQRQARLDVRRGAGVEGLRAPSARRAGASSSQLRRCIIASS